MSTDTKPRHIRMPQLYKDTQDFQEFLWRNGISWHNTFSNECCKDFSCCNHLLGTGWWHLSFNNNILGTPAELEHPLIVRDKMLYFLNEMADEKRIKGGVTQAELSFMSRVRKIYDTLIHVYNFQPVYFSQLPKTHQHRPGHWSTMN